MAKFKLPRKVTNLEEAPAVFREAYVEREGAFHLDPERLESIEWDDKEELAGALERERKERREAKADLEKYKDINPEKAREALARLDEIDNRKLRDKGEFDRLMEKKQAEWTAEKAALEAQVKDSSQQLRAFRLTNKVKEEAEGGGA